MYSDLINNLMKENNIKLKGYKTNLTGVAYPDERSIIIPKPTTKLRLSICLHEVGHIVLNHNNKKKRYIEEKEAWDFALNYMKKEKIPITKKVRIRRKESINYAIGKAMRRGLKDKVFKNIFKIDKDKEVKDEKDMCILLERESL